MNHREPIHVMLPVLDLFEFTCDAMIRGGLTEDFTFGEFSSILDVVLPLVIPIDGGDRQYATQALACYIDIIDASKLLSELTFRLQVMLSALALPIYPEMGFQYRAYVTYSGLLNIHYEYTNPINNLQQMNKDELIKSLERGDYVSERIRRNYGL